MLLRKFALAGVMAITTGTVAQAQGLNGPAEQPPPGFSGQQYVDSRGCVFLRAGVAGTTNWVPRVSRDRRQICGQIPSFSPEPAVVAETRSRRAGDPIDTVASTPASPEARARAAAAPAPSYAARPVAVATPAPAPAPAAAPVEAARVEAPRAVRPRDLGDGRLACPASSPYLGRFALRSGGTTLLCSDSERSFGSLVGGWRVETAQVHAPIERGRTPVARASADPAPAAGGGGTAPVGVSPRTMADGRIACPASSPHLRAFPTTTGRRTWLCTDAEGGFGSIVAGWDPETGLTRAPMTGATTGRGGHGAHSPAATPEPAQVARRELLGAPVLVGGTGYDVAAPAVPKGWRPAWTDDRLNPNRGVGTPEGQAAQDRVWTRDVPAKPVAEAPQTRRVTVSTSGTPHAAPAAGRFFVQVGSFGEPANAARSRARLGALGLPVAAGRGTIKGKPVEVVRAGPFATQAEARAALARARGAGFADAFIR